MENAVKKHAAAALGFLLIVAVRILLGLDISGGVWSFFSNTPPFQWLQERWPTMTADVGWWLTFLLDLGILGFVAWLFIALLRWRKDCRRWETLADEDSQQMVKRIIVIEESKKAVLYLIPTGPHVILQVKLVNTSVYPLTLVEKVENRVTYWHNPLPQEPEIYRTKDFHQPITINHGDLYQLEIRQFLPSDVASLLAQIKDTVEFGVPKVAIRFTYQDRTGVTQQVRIRLGLPFFTKGRLAVSARS